MTLFDPLMLMVFACIAVWAAAYQRWRRRLPVLPYEPHRRVPWNGFDVLLLCTMFYVLSPALILGISEQWFGVSTAPVQEATPLDADHPLMRVLLEGHNFWALLLGVVSAIVIAPITEEFVFRLLLQGWLESLERRMRRRIPALRRIMLGIVPVMSVAMLFAAMHIRTPEPRAATSAIVVLLGVQAVVSLLMVAASVCWLKFVAGATLADFGIVPKKLAADIRLGLLTLVAVAAPVYTVMIAAKEWLPKTVVADPIPLLLLAAALGTLYYRTHRIAPSLVLHAAFNAISVFLAIAASS
jgi:membrane protease YdiL (CAAX protease family)